MSEQERIRILRIYHERGVIEEPTQKTLARIEAGLTRDIAQRRARTTRDTVGMPSSHLEEALAEK